MANKATNDAPCQQPSRSPRPLHVILEHRKESEFRTYLESLRTKAPEKLTIFSDFQWIESGQIITRSQKERLFDALGEIAHGLKVLQIDLLCDLFLSDVEMDLLLANSHHHHNLPQPSQSHEESIVERLQVLPCTLITRLLEKAHKLESLALKELWLSGSPFEVDELVKCLQSHPKLHKVDLRWKLANYGTGTGTGTEKQPQQHYCAVLDPLVVGICQMPHLTQINLMIPHWIPSLLEVLPYSTTLSTIKLTVDRHQKGPKHYMASLLHKLKYHNNNPTPLRHLELSAFDIMQQAGPALLELLQDNSHLQHLTVVDHNIFSRRRSSSNTTSKGDLPNMAMTNPPSFTAEQLVAALQTNTGLKRLQLISKTFSRRRQRNNHNNNSSSSSSDRGRELFAQLLEMNLNLEQIDISHGKLQLSAPILSDFGSGGGQPCHSPINSKSSTKDNHLHQRQHFPVDALDFYLHLNQDGYRRSLLMGNNESSNGNCSKDTTELWQLVMQKYHQDSASLFALLQGCPSIVSAMQCVSLTA